VRVGGDLDRPVRVLAVCGGAGDDLFGAVRAAGADAFVTADLRHHPASEALEHGAPALVDVAHWASEWPWLADCERLLRRGLGDRADTVETRVSQLVTDPWTFATLTGPPPPTRSST
jgi:putative NIF3 family GTP cyclohydrolase 1 type 2